MKHNDYLTIEELTRVMNYDNMETNVTRDILLFSCFTGMDFSDIGIIQAGDFYTDDAGKKWLGLYNPLPLRFDKMLVTPALAKIVERNSIGKNREDMLFISPSRLQSEAHFRIIEQECGLNCKLEITTGEKTCEYSYDQVSQSSFVV